MRNGDKKNNPRSTKATAKPYNEKKQRKRKNYLFIKL